MWTWARLRHELGLDRLDPLTRRVLTALAALTLAQVLLPAMGVSLSSLRWLPFGAGFQLWHPLSFMIAPAGSLLDPLLSMLTCLFLLPALQIRLSESELKEILGAAWAVGVSAALLSDAVGFGSGSLAGWTLLLLPVISMVGLALPDVQLRFFGLIPIPHPLVIYGPGALALWWVLTAPAGNGDMLSSAFSLGAWSGPFAWWHLRGPGATQRRPRTPARRPAERDLRRFQVLPGGRDQDVHRVSPRSQRSA
jgi:hypothetical protein